MESESHKLTLSPADAAAADALLNGEPGGDAARQQRVQAWLQALDGSPMPEPAGDLAARTLAAVQSDHLNIASHLSKPARPPGAWRRRLAEFGAMAIAAMLLLAVSVEGLGTARASAKRVACQANLKTFVTGFNTYSNLDATGTAGELPMLAMPANASWLRGNTEPGAAAAMNNAANLLPLVTRRLVPVKALFCAGAGIPDRVDISTNQVPDIGYSYRDMAAPDKPRWDGLASTIILADKNPVFNAMIRPELADKNSANHGGKGSYLLRADGSVSWELHPDAGPDHDNIWTIGTGTTGKDRLALYTGREIPNGPKDVFLCP